MIRVVVETCDAGMAANVGGSVYRQIRSFDISAPELEAFLSERFSVSPAPSYCHRQVIGVELVEHEEEHRRDDRASPERI